MTSSQLADELEWLFMSDVDKPSVKKATGVILQSLKREGKVFPIGRTKSAVWAVKH